MDRVLLAYKFLKSLKGGPSAETKEQLKSLWFEIYIFDHSDGNKKRFRDFRRETYDVYFRNQRFDDGPLTESERLLKWKTLDFSERIKKISNTELGKALAIVFDDFISSGDETDDDFLRH